ncbi:hypothetical protein [Marinoscillum pacificum]|uniref:hypothetical protein n=1 Tax=Marinoscillum pacificum TaxID=392723 RepID=UPI002157911E|nr:hypothetical protein [Marinoscillum pacificum]
MKSKVYNKPFLYLSIIVAVFIVLILLDQVFGFHYEPVEYKLAETEEDHSPTIEHDKDTTSEFSSFQHEAVDDEKIELAEKGEHSDAANAPVEKETKPDATSNNSTPKDYFASLIKSYKQNTLSKLEKNKARTDIVIRYYHHEPDGNSAYALGNLGYYIHEREVSPEYLNYQSNAIFYGDSVSLTDLQIVSYTLLEEGLPIKIIKPSKFHDSWKAHSIEIGTDTTALNKPTVTFSQIQALTL